MDYSDSLDKIYERVGFKEIKRIKFSEKSGYFVILGEYLGEKVVLRTTPVFDQGKISKLTREYQFSLHAEEFNRNSNKKISHARVLLTDSDSVLFWSIRQFLDSKTLGEDVDHDKEVLHNFDLIRSEFIDHSSDLVNSIVQNIELIKMMKKNNLLPKEVDYGLFTKRLHEDLSKYDIPKIEKLLSVNLSKQASFYNLSKEQYFADNNLSVVMGDLIPANIIVSNDKNITLFDFEWACVDNYQFDLTYLWLYLWRYENWQKDLGQYILKNHQDQTFFQLSVIRQLIAWFNDALLTKDSSELERITTFYKKHKWLKYLKVAGSSTGEFLKIASSGDA